MTITPLLSWLLTGTLLLGAWYGCYHLALRRERSFGYNRAFLVAGPLLAAGLPLLPTRWLGALPGWLGWREASADALPRLAAVLLPVVQIGPLATAPVDWSFWLTGLYLTGVVVALARLALGLGRLWWQARRLPAEAHPGYTLRRTGGRLPTSSFGQVVFWDETLALTPAEAAQVLRHELAHVRQSHTLDHLLLAVLRAVLWPNPFVHLCGRALTLTHEFLADAAALKAAPATTAYAGLLARQVAFQLGFAAPLAHSFSHSPILTRIAMLHQTAPVRRWKQWLILPLLTLFALVLGPVAQAQNTPPAPPAPPAAPTPPPPPVVYETADQMPELPGGGGPEAIVAFIQNKMEYPKLPPAEQRDGTVFATFIVAEQGEAQAIKIVKGLAPAYDEAVLAAMRQLPRFAPGRMNFPARRGGPRAVAVSYTVPVRFLKQAPPAK